MRYVKFDTLYRYCKILVYNKLLKMEMGMENRISRHFDNLKHQNLINTPGHYVWVENVMVNKTRQSLPSLKV